MPDSVFISIQPDAFGLPAGGTAVCRVTVHNDVERVGQYQLHVEFPVPEWAWIKNDQLGVFPHDQASTDLELRPPLDTTPAIYTLIIHATSQMGDELQAKADFTLTVYPAGTPVGASGLVEPAKTPALPASAWPVSIGLDAELVRVKPGEETLAHLKVCNEGGDVGQYKLQADVPDPSWARLVPDQVGVFPGDSTPAEIHLTPPAQVIPATYPITIRAVSQVGEPLQAETSLAVMVSAQAVQEKAGAELPLQGQPGAEGQGLVPAHPVPIPQTFLRAPLPGAVAGLLELYADTSETILFPVCEIDAGHRLNEHQLTLKNTSGLSLNIEMMAQGLPGNWFSLSQSVLQLYPEESQSMQLRLNPTPEAPPGQYPFSLTAQAREDRSHPLRLDLVLGLTEPGHFKMHLSPPWAESQSFGEFEVQLHQSGPTPIHLELAGEDNDNGCEYIFAPGPVIIPPYGSLNWRLVVEPRTRDKDSSSVLYEFTVTATTIEGARTTTKAHARFVQLTPPPPRLTLKSAPSDRVGAKTFLVQLENPTEMNAEFKLVGSDTDRACLYQFMPESLDLAAGSKGQAILYITPQRYQSRRGDQIITFTVVADPVGSLIHPAEGKGQFTQKQLEPPGVALDPSSQNAPHSARYNLKIKNPRKTPIDVTIRPYDQKGVFKFALRTSKLRVEPQSQAMARLTAHSQRKLQSPETYHPYKFRVDVTVSDLAEPVTVEGTLVQVLPSPLSLFFFFALFLIVVGAALSLILGYQLLQEWLPVWFH